IPVPRVGYPYITAPFATFPTSYPVVLVRLACLIHAANVRSEPGSNPSKIISFTGDARFSAAGATCFRLRLTSDGSSHASCSHEAGAKRERGKGHVNVRK